MRGKRLILVGRERGCIQIGAMIIALAAFLPSTESKLGILLAFLGTATLTFLIIATSSSLASSGAVITSSSSTHHTFIIQTILATPHPFPQAISFSHVLSFGLSAFLQLFSLDLFAKSFLLSLLPSFFTFFHTSLLMQQVVLDLKHVTITLYHFSKVIYGSFKRNFPLVTILL